MSFKKKILLVDADESVRRNFCAFLEAEGDEVDFAENSQHALEKTTQAFYHLIFLANTLPDIFGVDLIPKIKKQHPETAIIFITDFNTQEY
ncbi:MAG TPA: response regulator, partial [Anaerolineales bacterium]|nr:response regulator [Anaerolineales bacterium]